MDKTYFLTPNSKKRYLTAVITTSIVGLIGIYLILWFSDVIHQIPFLVFLPPAFGIFQIIYSINYYSKKHIVLSNVGIEYNTLRAIFLAKWQDLEKISTGWHEQFKKEGIMVDKLKLETKNSIQELPSMQYFPSKSSKAFIPLSCFVDNWRDSDLGQQIKQHAPHLFEKEKSAQSA